MSDTVSLAQWRCAIAVVDAGGYAQAAEQLGKSQSSLSYQIAQLEEKLGQRIFTLQGRRAVLTSAGQILCDRARRLLEQANQIESLSACLNDGGQALVRVALDILFPEQIMLAVLGQFTAQWPQTRIELIESALSGTHDAIVGREVDMAISAQVPVGFLGTPLINMRSVACTAPDHPLQQLDRPIDLDDLTLHRQLVIRDSGRRNIDAGWLKSTQRLTVSHFSTSIRAVCQGLGFAWLPEEKIQAELASGALKVLPLSQGQYRVLPLYLIYPSGDNLSPVTRALGAQLMAHCARLPSAL